MNSKIIDGAALAGRIVRSTSSLSRLIAKSRANPPSLAVVAFGDDPAAQSYTQKQLRVAPSAGVQVKVRRLGSKTNTASALKLIDELNQSPWVDAILIETPLPRHLSLVQLLDHLSPAKDVEGLTPTNYGKLFSVKNFEEFKIFQGLMPPTALAIMELLKTFRKKISGLDAVVVGRSNVVGRPVAHLLSCFDATVTLCHSKTHGIARYLRKADIVISAVGKPHYLKGSDLKRGSVVIDAGISYKGKKLCGDVDFITAQKVARAISPVPGGVGPVTTAVLLSNVAIAAQKTL